MISVALIQIEYSATMPKKQDLARVELVCYIPSNLLSYLSIGWVAGLTSLGYMESRMEILGLVDGRRSEHVLSITMGA